MLHYSYFTSYDHMMINPKDDREHIHIYEDDSKKVEKEEEKLELMLKKCGYSKEEIQFLKDKELFKLNKFFANKNKILSINKYEFSKDIARLDLLKKLDLVLQSNEMSPLGKIKSEEDIEIDNNYELIEDAYFENVFSNGEERLFIKNNNEKLEEKTNQLSNMKNTDIGKYNEIEKAIWNKVKYFSEEQQGIVEISTSGFKVVMEDILDKIELE